MNSEKSSSAPHKRRCTRSTNNVEDFDEKYKGWTPIDGRIVNSEGVVTGRFRSYIRKEETAPKIVNVEIKVISNGEKRTIRVFTPEEVQKERADLAARNN